MQNLPPGQYETKEWPILTVGSDANVSKESWSLSITGEVENPQTWNFQEFCKLPSVDLKLDFHCVTTWSLLGSTWTGVLFKELVKIVKPKDSVKYVLQRSCDPVNYTTGTELKNLMYDDVIIAYKRNGEDIPIKHGGPVRIINPHLYAYKSAKWLCEMAFLNEQVLGYWEEKGYSEQADPWKEQRYTSDDIQ